MEDPEPDPPEVTNDLGEVVGGYRLEERIASGGMGHVYAATHLRLGRRAAVKVLNTKFANDTTVLSRFYHEARIANDIRHPNIVDIFDFVELADPKRVACVMELLVGPSLKKLLKASPLSVEQAINVTLQLGDALVAVHQRGVIHRDLKPENVVVVGDAQSSLAEVPSVKLLDFGIAKLPDELSPHKTGTGLVLGTPAYMAPEQIAGEPISAATDVYALGEILFEMLSGRRAFPGKSKDIFREKLAVRTPALLLSILTPDREALGEVIARCLAGDPERRISLFELQNRLRERLGQLGPAGAKRPEPPPEAPAPIPPTPTKAARSPPVVIIGTPDLPINAWAPTADLRPSTPAPPLPPTDTLPPIPGLVAEGRGGDATTGSPVESPFAAFDRAPAAPARVVEPKAPLPVPKPPRMVRPRFVLSLLLVIGLVATLSISSAARHWVAVAVGKASELLIADQGAPLTLTPADRQRLRARRDAIAQEATGGRADAPELEILRARNNQNTDRVDGYRAATIGLTRALAAAPESPAILAEWARALALARGERLTADEEADAKAVLALAADLQPGLPAIDLAEAELALARRQWAAAKTRAAAVLEQLPEDATARITLAAALARTSPSRALRELALATKAGGDHQRRTDRVAARALASTGRYRAAFEILDRRLKADPRNAAVLQLYGDLEDELGRSNAALARYEAAALGDGDRTSPLLSAGWVLLRQRAFGKAEEHFALVTKSPDGGERLRDEAIVAHARLILTRRDPHFPEALKASLAALPDHPGARLAEAELVAQSGAWTHAAAILRGMEDLPESRRAVAVLLSRAALAQGEAASADRLLEQALLEAPWDQELRVVRAAAQLDQDQSANALALIRATAEVDPRARPRAEARFPLARLVVEDARRRWEGASKEPTLAAEASVALAMLAAAEGREDEARAQLTTALTADPKLAAAHAVAASLGGPDEALNRAKAWVAADPGSAFAQLALARALLAKGQKDPAIQAYAACLASKPDLGLAVLESLLLQADGKVASERLASALEAHPDWPALRSLARARER